MRRTEHDQPSLRTRHAGVLSAAALVCLGLATQAIAQGGTRPVFLPMPESEPLTDVIEPLLAGLDSETCAERERCFIGLAELRTLDLQAVEKLLERDDLSAEQRARLSALAWERFATSPRAAMGVSFFSISERPHYVAIETVIEGFPSGSVLQSGDIIVEIENVPVHGPYSREFVRANIIGRDPGDELDLVVRRGAERLSLTVTLGSFDTLSQRGSHISAADYASAWWARNLAKSRDRAVVRLQANAPAASAWPIAVWEDADAARQMRFTRITGDIVPQLAGGGAAGQSLEPDVGDAAEIDDLAIAKLGGIAVVNLPRQQVLRNGQMQLVHRRQGFNAPAGWLNSGPMPAGRIEAELRLLDEAQRTLSNSVAPVRPPNNVVNPGQVAMPLSDPATKLAVLPKIREGLLAELAESAQREPDADALLETEERRGG